MNGERSTNHASGDGGISGSSTRAWNSGVGDQDYSQKQLVRCSEEATLILSAAIAFCMYSVKMVCSIYIYMCAFCLLYSSYIMCIYSIPIICLYLVHELWCSILSF